MNWPTGRVLVHHYEICCIDCMSEGIAVGEDGRWVYWGLLKEDSLSGEGTDGAVL